MGPQVTYVVYFLTFALVFISFQTQALNATLADDQVRIHNVRVISG